MLKRDFLYRKVKLIQEELAKLEPLAHYSMDEIARDPVKAAAAERMLERIVNRALDINQHLIAELGVGNEVVRRYQDTFLRLGDLGVLSPDLARQIAPSAGFRNVLVHEYDEVDPAKVYQSMADALVQYSQYTDAIIRFVDQHTEPGARPRADYPE
jgi:uncharacterized protein YutE (UPF0331/DUF86 family)